MDQQEDTDMKKLIVIIALILNNIHFGVSAPNVSENLDSLNAVLQNAGDAINSAFADFAPVISADGSTLMFTSRRPVTEKEVKAGKPVKERIFISAYDKVTGKWSNATVLGPEVNSPGRNNSAIALSHDGQRLLIFRDDIKGNGDIYESILKGSKWSEAVRLPEPLNSAYHESSACYSHDGKTIYFVSNRKGGIGGRDIWFATRKSGSEWNEPINLGSEINTRQDEEGVFMHPDGKTLYFSSRGHNTKGGHDIFRSKFENGKWSVPENLGKPLNTQGDDVFFVLEANGLKGYYASSAPGGMGNVDIYFVSFVPVEKGPKLTILKGMIYDEVTKAPVEATIEIIDNSNSDNKFTISSNSESGNYLLSLPAGKNYGISVNAPGYLFHSENIYMPDTSDYTEIEKNIGLKKLEIGNTIVLNNIFYDFDKSTLRSESMNELEKLEALLIQNNTLTIELSSHTDGKGTDEYNLKLSQARAQSVVDYLKAKGIAESRLIPKGYGKSKPIASNDTEEGRQMNRRTEFKIISK